MPVRERDLCICLIATTLKFRDLLEPPSHSPPCLLKQSHNILAAARTCLRCCLQAPSFFVFQAARDLSRALFFLSARARACALASVCSHVWTVDALTRVLPNVCSQVLGYWATGVCSHMCMLSGLRSDMCALMWTLSYMCTRTRPSFGVCPHNICDVICHVCAGMCPI